MAQNGNNLIVSLNGAAIAGTKVDEIQSACEAIEVCSPITGQWREYIAGRKGWTVNCNYLLGTMAEIANLLKVGTFYTLSIGTRGKATLSGTAMMTNCVITAQKGNLLQGSFSFQGTAELKKV